MQKGWVTTLGAAAVSALLGATLAVWPGQTARAGETESPKAQAEAGRLQEVAQKLQLTDAQLQQLQAIHQSIETKGRALKADQSRPEAQRAAEFSALRQNAEQQIKAVLTADQVQKLQQMGGVMAVFLGEAEPQGGPGAVLERLGLSEAQGVQLKSTLSAVIQSVEAIRNDASLSETDKKARLMAAVESLHTQLQSVLSTDQVRKLESLGGAQALLKMTVGSRMEGMGGMVVEMQIAFSPLEKLGLSPDQRSRIQAVLSGAKQQAERIVNDSSVSNKKPALIQLEESTRSQVQSLLTDQQRADFQKMRSEGGAQKEGMASLFEQLGLSDAQKIRIKVVIAGVEQQMAAVKADGSLSEDQKKAKLEALHTQGEQQVYAIFTPDQQNLADRLHPRGPEGK